MSELEIRLIEALGDDAKSAFYVYMFFDNVWPTVLALFWLWFFFNKRMRKFYDEMAESINEEDKE